MTTLLVIIYITFISLGLPDSLFGAAWPVMHGSFGLPESYAAMFSLVTGVGASISSFFAGRLIRRYGTGLVTFFSVLLTAVALIGVSVSPSTAFVFGFCLLLGLGAGAVDSGLNNFVVLHYKAIHMNWLHCFWGVGVTASPLIMSRFLAGGDWRGGYRTVFYIQIGIAMLLLLTLPLWKKAAEEKQLDTKTEKTAEKKSFWQIFKTPGVPLSVLSIGLYCAMEFVVGTWGASYAVNSKGLAPDEAARWVSLFFGGIMLGRFLAGIISIKVSDKNLIRGGIVISVLGMVLLALPIGASSLMGLLLLGLGFGPIYPSTIHIIPERFGAEYSADITGYHMGLGYTLSYAAQITFGFAAAAYSYDFMPYMFLVIAAALLVLEEALNKITAKRAVSGLTAGGRYETEI